MNDAALASMTAAGTDFGFRLLARLTQAAEGNVFFSPLSVSCALTMALAGAGGQTQRGMVAALGLGAMTSDQIDRASGLLQSAISRQDPQVQLSVANALWASTRTKFSADFERRCREFYGAHAATLDLGQPAAADVINDWVSRNTRGKIARLVSHKEIAQATAVLTNAVYFHGLWQTPFDGDNTHDAPFVLADGATKTVALMGQTGTLPYLDSADFQAVSLPYGTGRVSLVVFLPKPGISLDAFLGALDAGAWETWLGAMKPTRLALSLPRFKAEYRATLNSALIDMGMGEAFSIGADFRPMGLGGSMLGPVIHKAILEVDEEGTVAAAATAVVMMRSAMSRPNPVPAMRVDRPFFCAICDNETGALLFAGAVRDPQ